MNEFWITVLVNVFIGIIVVLGFLTFWGKSSGWLNEGGFIYEYFKNKKEQKRKLKHKQDDDD